MSDDDKNKKSIGEKLSAEDIVIIVAIVITLLLTPFLAYLWFLEKPILIPPPIISVFLGIAVSALLYRFLGGVHDASFTVGALKVTGTAAILLGVSWWVNGELVKHLPEQSPNYPPFVLQKDVSPKPKSWYAVDLDTGKPIELEFGIHNQSHTPPENSELDKIRANRNLGIKDESGSLLIFSKDTTNIVGFISESEIENMGYHNNISINLAPYRVESFSAVEEIDISASLPFTISTNGFSENYTRFVIKSKADQSILLEDSILLRGAKIFKHNSKYYLISVIQLNHAPEDIEPYAKFYVAEIIINYV